jgi:ABC-type lipopolysaccharide export system ATPase subunit
MTYTLAADSIQLSYDNRRILSDIYIQCEAGKITGLLGRNGCGKSSLLNIIYGTLRCDDKSVRINNTSFPQAFRRPDLLRYLPQHQFIPPRFTLKRVLADFNVSFPALEEAFPEYRRMHNTALGNLSGGQRRFLEVYCIVKSASRFAMLDEPFSFLSPIQVERLKKVLIEEKQHKGFIITDHMYPHILDVADNMYLLQNGKAHAVAQKTDLERLGYLRPGQLP